MTAGHVGNVVVNGFRMPVFPTFTPYTQNHLLW